MNKIILISLVIFFAICSKSWAEECPGSPATTIDKDVYLSWHNCIGTLWKNEFNYIGEWRNGWREGKGIIYINNVKVYDGTFKLSHATGVGIHYCKDGTSHVSQVKIPEIGPDTEICKKRMELSEKEKELEEKAKRIIAEEKETFENAKLECEAIGYKKGTEKFGECVLDLTE